MMKMILGIRSSLIILMAIFVWTSKTNVASEENVTTEESSSGDGGENSGWRGECASIVADVFWAGDLICDDNLPGYNTQACNYDNGDCCPQTNSKCTEDPQKPCICRDPQFAQVADANNMSVLSDDSWFPLTVTRWTSSYGSNAFERINSIHLSGENLGEGIAVGYVDGDDFDAFDCGALAFDPETMYPGYVPPTFGCGDRDVLLFPFDATTGKIVESDEGTYAHKKYGSSRFEHIYDLTWAPEPVSRYIAVGVVKGEENMTTDTATFATCDGAFSCGGEADMLAMSLFGYYNRDVDQTITSGSVKIAKVRRFGGSMFDAAFGVAVGTGSMSEYGFIVGSTESDGFGGCYEESHEPTVESEHFYDYAYECGSRDIVVAKIDLKNMSIADRTLVKRIGRGGDERGVAIAVDENHRVYVVGNAATMLAKECTESYPSQCGGESDMVVLMFGDGARMERLSVLQFGSQRSDIASGIIQGAISGQMFMYGRISGDLNTGATENAKCQSFTYNDEDRDTFTGQDGGQCGGSFDGVMVNIEVDNSLPVHEMVRVRWYSRWGGKETDDRPASSFLTSDTGRLFVVGNTYMVNVSTVEFVPTSSSETGNFTKVDWVSAGHIGPCISGWQDQTCGGDKDIFLSEFNRTDGTLMYTVRLGSNGDDVAEDAFETTGGIVIGGSTIGIMASNESGMNETVVEDSKLWAIESLQCACGQEPVHAAYPLYGSGIETPLVRSANGIVDIPFLCRFCDEGFYSSDGRACTKCPMGATCTHEMNISQGVRGVGSAVPVAVDGFHRSSHSADGTLIVSQALVSRRNFLGIFRDELGEYEYCRDKPFDTSIHFNRCFPAHDGTSTCLRGNDNVTNGSVTETGGTCANGYLESVVCAQCDRENGWTRLQGRQMCVECYSQVQMATTLSCGIFALAMLGAAYKCVIIDAPPRGSNMSRHTLRNMYGANARRKREQEAEAAKIATAVSVVSKAQLELLGGDEDDNSNGMNVSLTVNEANENANVRVDMSMAYRVLKKRFDRIGDNDDDDDDLTYLDKDAFDTFARQLSPMLTDRQLVSIFALIDTKHDSAIDWEELSEWIARCMNESTTHTAQAAIMDMIQAIRMLGQIEKRDDEEVDEETDGTELREDAIQGKSALEASKEHDMLVVFASFRVLLCHLQFLASMTKTFVVRWPTYLWSFFLLFDAVDLHVSMVGYWVPCIVSDELVAQEYLAVFTRLSVCGSGLAIMLWFLVCSFHWESRCFWADFKERRKDYEYFVEPEWIEARFASRVVLRRAFTPLVWCLMIVYVPITRSAIEVLNCRDLDGERRMTADSTVRCSSESGLYVIAFGLACMVLVTVTIGFPISLFRTLRRQQLQLKRLRELEEEKNGELLQARYLRRTQLVKPLRSLHCGYSESYFQFELIELLRKLVFCVSFGFLWPDSQWQAYAWMLCTGLYLFVHCSQVYDPVTLDDSATHRTGRRRFEFRHVATMHVISVIIQLANVFAGTLFMDYPAGEIVSPSTFVLDVDPTYGLTLCAGAAVILANMIFVASSINWMWTTTRKRRWCWGRCRRWDPQYRSLTRKMRHRKIRTTSSATQTDLSLLTKLERENYELHMEIWKQRYEKRVIKKNRKKIQFEVKKKDLDKARIQGMLYKQRGDVQILKSERKMLSENIRKLEEEEEELRKDIERAKKEWDNALRLRSGRRTVALDNNGHGRREGVKKRVKTTKHGWIVRRRKVGVEWN